MRCENGDCFAGIEGAARDPARPSFRAACRARRSRNSRRHDHRGACGAPRDRSRRDVEGHAGRRRAIGCVLALVPATTGLSEEKLEPRFQSRFPARDGQEIHETFGAGRRRERARRLQGRGARGRGAGRTGSLLPGRTATDRRLRGVEEGARRGQVRRHPPGAGRGTHARLRRATRFPDRDRGRARLQARNLPLQRRSMPPFSTRTEPRNRSSWARLRDRTGPDDRRHRRAAPRRERNRLAAQGRAVRRPRRRAHGAEGAGRARRRSLTKQASPYCSTIATCDRVEKFADADLIGIPTRVTVGRKTLEDGTVDVRDRATGDEQRVQLRTRRRRGSAIAPKQAIQRPGIRPFGRAPDG